MDQISSQYLLEMKNISKSFSGVRALDNADFYLKKGEVHVLMGANGAGKSTLMKILSGCYEKDKGKILIDGNEVNIKTTKDAQQHGIAIIHQHFSQVPHLSVAENIFLGREKLQGVCIDYDYLYEKANELLNLMDVHNIDVKEKLIQLSISQKQIIEIAKALSFNSKILIMDEPTSALTKKETAVLFALIRNLVSRGVGIIYISHRIDELNQIGDRVTVMKDGKIVGTKNVKDVGIHELVKMMVGKEIDFIERKNNDTSDFKTRKILLELKNVCVRKTGLKN
ncbi:ATP-binding cassette domain-containing protein [Treponema parvum]|nr:ATP-binding cassette domain-containing protein [Treponema parvum]QTQ16047.1 sugar ABC transporter ATP-binding protein [Treponema parvum]